MLTAAAASRASPAGTRLAERLLGSCFRPTAPALAASATRFASIRRIHEQSRSSSGFCATAPLPAPRHSGRDVARDGCALRGKRRCVVLLFTDGKDTAGHASAPHCSRRRAQTEEIMIYFYRLSEGCDDGRVARQRRHSHFERGDNVDCPAARHPGTMCQAADPCLAAADRRSTGRRRRGVPPPPIFWLRRSHAQTSRRLCASDRIRLEGAGWSRRRRLLRMTARLIADDVRASPTSCTTSTCWRSRPRYSTTGCTSST